MKEPTMPVMLITFGLFGALCMCHWIIGAIVAFLLLVAPIRHPLPTVLIGCILGFCILPLLR